MKKNVFRMVAIAILAMGMTLASCEKDPQPANPNGGNTGGNGGGNGGGTTTSTIVSKTFSTPQVISMEGSVDIEGNQLMFAIESADWALISAYGGVAVLSTADQTGYDYDKVIRLNEGAEIGASGHYTQDNSADLAPWGNNTGYVGIRFSKGGNTHYGWVKIAYSTSSANVTVYGYAYEGTAGKSIKAGATK